MTRTVFTLFSDDVRQELGGKVSYMGVYNGRMLIASFPALLPKLCLTLKISTPSSRPFKEAVVKVYKDEELIAEGSIPPERLIPKKKPEESSAKADNGNKRQTIQLGFVFTPFTVDKACFLRVRVETEEGELRGTGLRIIQAPEGMVTPDL